MTYVDVIFVQDSDPVEELGDMSPRDALFNFDGHIANQGPTDESVRLVADYLAQWDFGSETDGAHTAEGNPGQYADYSWTVETDGGMVYGLHADVLGSVWLTRAPLNN